MGKYLFSYNICLLFSFDSLLFFDMITILIQEEKRKEKMKK